MMLGINAGVSPYAGRASTYLSSSARSVGAVAHVLTDSKHQQPGIDESPLIVGFVEHAVTTK